jgi:4,5-DOPA dioxygenase extradiol
MMGLGGVLTGGGRPAPAAGGTAPGAPITGGSTMPEDKDRAPNRRMPVLFVGHGSPMNAIEDNPWSRGFRSLASLIPEPAAIVAVSAHWFVPGTFLTGNARPETIHDFGGFPQELYEVQYPAPGQPDLARRISRLIGEMRSSVRDDWGLDHGTWSVLRHLRPEADLPVIQLSIDERMRPADHLALGRMLAPLREERVLIMGSGNLVHNLRHAFGSLRSGDLSTPEWAVQFDADLARAIEQRDAAYLSGALDGGAGQMAHPTPDHYLPLLYAAGAADSGDPVRFPIEGFDLSSISMRAVLFG